MEAVRFIPKYTLLSLSLLAPLYAGNGTSRLIYPKGTPPGYEVVGASSAIRLEGGLEAAVSESEAIPLSISVGLGSYKELLDNYLAGTLNDNNDQQMRGITAVLGSIAYDSMPKRARWIKDFDKFIENIHHVPEGWVAEIVTDLRNLHDDHHILFLYPGPNREKISAQCERYNSRQARFFLEEKRKDWKDTDETESRRAAGRGRRA